jgi:hypothetical protein
MRYQGRSQEYIFTEAKNPHWVSPREFSFFNSCIAVGEF